jgi:DNA invertase Pin-like site-specific DNA recombinase
MNTYGLVRISSHIQSEKNGGTSIQYQTEKIKQYSDLNDLHLEKVITDVCSGSYDSRDGITELKTLITNGKVDVVLTWSTSRTFRSMIAFSKFYEFLKDNDVILISISEGISSDRKEGEMMFGIMCSIASYEREIIKERLMSGKIIKLNKGIRSIGGSLPYGYTTDKKGEIIIDEEESRVVEYIFRKTNLLSKMKHLTPIKRTKRMLKLLKYRGFQYRDGVDFKPYHLRWILNNEFYFGVMNYGNISVIHQHPTIVSKRLYNQVNRRVLKI